MEKIDKPIYKNYPPVKLFIDDLISIYEILKKNYNRVEIKANNLEIADLNNLKNSGINKITTFVYSCTRFSEATEYANVTFKPEYIEMYFQKDITINRRILSEIKKVLRKRILPFGSFFQKDWHHNIFGWIMWFLFIISTLGIPIFNLDSLKWPFLTAYFIIGTGGLLINSVTSKDYANIMLIYKREENSFWIRNKEKIGVVIFAGLFGAAISFVITYSLLK